MGSKTYKVTTLPDAQRGIDETIIYIARDSPENAMKWADGIEDLIQSLSSNPNRFGRARENRSDEITLRHVVYHSHRVVYEVDEATREVTVLTVFHSSRDRWLR